MIRTAVSADVEGIARVHVLAWHETYTVLVPPEAFDHHSLGTRVAQWRATLSDRQRSTLVYENDGTLGGFVSGGPIKWTGLSLSSEVTSFYLLDAFKRRGIGRALFGEFTNLLAQRGFTSCGLWTLSNNVGARRFYEAMGGRTGGTHIDVRNGIAFEDIAYTWDDVGHIT